MYSSIFHILKDCKNKTKTDVLDDMLRPGVWQIPLGVCCLMIRFSDFSYMTKSLDTSPWFSRVCEKE